MQTAMRLVRVPFLPSQLATLEGRRVVRRRQTRLRCLWLARLGNCEMNVARPFDDRLGELALVVGEIQERDSTRRTPAPERAMASRAAAGAARSRAVSSRRHTLMQSRSVAGVGNLIVILDEDHERLRRNAVGACAARLSSATRTADPERGIRAWLPK